MRPISPFFVKLIFLSITPIYMVRTSADVLLPTNTEVSSGTSELTGMTTGVDRTDVHQLSSEYRHRISKRTRLRGRCPTCSCASCSEDLNALAFMGAISASYGGVPSGFPSGMGISGGAIGGYGGAIGGYGGAIGGFGGGIGGYGGMSPGVGPTGGFGVPTMGYGGQPGGNRQQTPSQTRGPSVPGVKSPATKPSPVSSSGKSAPGSFGSQVAAGGTTPAAQVNVVNQAIYNITNIENKPSTSTINIEDKPSANLTNLLYEQNLNLTNAPNENNLGIVKADQYGSQGSDGSLGGNDITGNATQGGGGCPEGYECV
ncbi:hypothetical protein DFH28DRAFT_160453 [Melampsora americana]|nr:hypothetical protein DFH28DRAFT_160453 [Melampsora americana]